MPRFDVTAFSNWTIAFLEITGSTVYGPHNAVLVGGGAGVGALDEEDELGGEQAQDAEAFGGPGLVFRPRPPEDVDTPDGKQRLAAEAIGARTSEGVVPFAWRDLRFNRVFPNPKAGTVALVGYGGGFLAFDDTTDDSGDQRATIETLYCPYEFSNGVPGKAHAVILDADEQAISIVHGEGQCILLQDDGTIRMQSPNGQNFVQVEDGMVTIQADQLVLNGGAVVIGNPLGPIVPLAAGPASPPCPRLFLNPAA